MGIAGGLVKSVFSKSRSFGTNDNINNARTNMAEKRRWNSVRSYLCGDELDSVRAEEDSGSVKSSTFTQLDSVLAEKDSASSESFKLCSTSTATEPNSSTKEAGSSPVNLSEATVTQPRQKHEQRVAAIVIQSAFRGFLARRRSEKPDTVIESGSPNRDESLGTSIEVQTGNSVEIFSNQEERIAVHHRTGHRTQAMKEEWDDSTVSCNISKMRIQNRLEATTRRERALAYAFSQQLRICSKKKEPKLDGTEPNMGWSWLERWMATRLPESSSGESCVAKPADPVHRSQMGRPGRGIFNDVTGEEKESCGSNEVPVSFEFDALSLRSSSQRDGLKPAQRSVSRRRTIPRCPKDYTKVKKEGSFKGEFKRQKA